MDTKSHIAGIAVTTRDDVVTVRVLGVKPSLITIHRFSVGNEAMDDADKVTAMVRHAMTMHSYQVMARIESILTDGEVV